MQEIKHPNTLEYFTCYKKEADIWVRLVVLYGLRVSTSSWRSLSM